MQASKPISSINKQTLARDKQARILSFLALLHEYLSAHS